MLYVESHGCIKTKVASGQAYLEDMINGRPLPVGYAAVSLDTLAKDKYAIVQLEMPMDDDRSMLAANMGSVVPWRKRNIVIIATMVNSSSDEDVEPPSNPKPTLALQPISEIGDRPHKIRKIISASDKETAIDTNHNNWHCRSNKKTEREQTGTK
jgi:hypothetical protein